MALHRLASVTIGVPDPAPVAAFYAEFGLTPKGADSFSTVDGGEQLRLEHAPHRRLVEIALDADDRDDLGRISAALDKLGIAATAVGARLETVDPASGTRVVVQVAPRHRNAAMGSAPTSGRPSNHRAPVLERDRRVAPRRLGHVVLGSPDQVATQQFFVEGLGFKMSDEIAGIAAFLRCSTDHHNVLVQGAPVAYLHHTSWLVDDVDEIGRGATALLDADPQRHVWGLGRHYIGSNFFWYLRDPAGNFAEYSTDMDVIDDDAQWTPEAVHDRRALYAWGPPVPTEFLEPSDLAALAAP